MKKLKSALLILLCLMMTCSVFVGCGNDGETGYALPHYDYSTRKGNEYNSKLFYYNTLEIGMGDPEVVCVEEDGETWFYTIGTYGGNSFKMWKSQKLTNWELIGDVYLPAENSFAIGSHWAPNLIWDETADWQYYLGENEEEGQGLWVLVFSAYNSQSKTQLQAAFSKSVSGPYTVFEGVNGNGDYCDASTYLFDVEKLKDLHLYEDHPYGPLYKKNRRFLDSYPFIDPVSGDKYLYFCRGGRNEGDKFNEIWGVKMADWATPIYETTTPLTAYGYTTIEKTEELDWVFHKTLGIDEGPVMYYKDHTDDGIDNGTYYLLTSVYSASQSTYSPIQALGTSPLGSFTKVQPQDGGFMGQCEYEWDLVAVGHNDLVEIGDELWNVYHTYKVNEDGSVGGRFLACDRVEWIQNDYGQDLMYTNGPSKDIQPLPELVSGYTNVARNATITATNAGSNDPKLLNDGVISMYGPSHIAKEFVTTASSTTVTITFDDWVSARAIMIYNSGDWQTMFHKVARVEFETENGTAYIKNLGFDVERSRVSYEYLGLVEDEIASGEFDYIRPLHASVAEFNEMKIKSVKVTVNKAKGKQGLGIADIYVLGKNL